MSWVNIQYESNLRKNDKRDGMKALAVYCLIEAVKNLVSLESESF